MSLPGGALGPLSSHRLKPIGKGISRSLQAFAVIIIVAVYTPVTEWLAWPLYDPPRHLHPVDAIVILEAWAADGGELNESGLKRAFRGAELYRERIAPVIVISGARARLERPGSALEPMARALNQSGVPQEAILIEDSSANTRDSAVHVSALAAKHHWTRIALVTDASHMRRASLAFERAGLRVSKAPTLIWNLGGAQPSLRFQRIGVLFHEYAGLLWYWARGWI